MSVIKFVGRALFVIFIINSAYVHLTAPELFKEEYSNNYQFIHNQATSFGISFIPPVEEVFYS